MNNPELHVTLWPSFSHFKRTALDQRVDGIRLNGPINFSLDRIETDVTNATSLRGAELYFDVKGKQLRVLEVHPYKNHLELKVTHRISVEELPATVLFKDGRDYATLSKVDGDMLIFEGGPRYEVLPCEPIYVRPPKFSILDNPISDYESKRIEIAKKYGIRKFMLSYVEDETDVTSLREQVGDESEIVAKIESLKGLEYVLSRFKKTDNLSLMLARGDLYVELNMPHEIITATRKVIEKDPEAMVGSRILHSLRNADVPECADFSELAWLYQIGYKRFLLCDELCLKENLLSRSISVFDAFRTTINGNKNELPTKSTTG